MMFFFSYHISMTVLKRKRLLITLVCLLLLMFSTLFFNQYNKLKLSVITDKVEYGSNFDIKQYVEYEANNISHDEIDTYTLGKQKVNIILKNDDSIFFVSRKYPVVFEVVDTSYPVIELYEEDVITYVNEEYDLKSNIKKIYDVVDGDIDINNASIVTDTDLSKAGEYTVTVIIKDSNDLQSSVSYNLTVKTNVDISEGYSYIYNYLTNNFDLNRAATCGILANIKFECGFNPNLGDYYYGLCQWGGSRKDNLYAWCNSNGYDSDSYDGQLEYMYLELKNNYPSVLTYLQNVENSASGAYDAAVYFCDVYEGAASNSGRGELASEYFQS